MKHSSPIDEENRFHGKVRYYHRAGGQSQRTWDEWVDGKQAGPGSVGKRLKVVAVILASLALLAVLSGLVVALW